MYPVRVAYPDGRRTSAPGSPSPCPPPCPGLGVPGLDGRGVVGRAARHRASTSRTRSSVRASRRASTSSRRGAAAIAQPHPTIPRRPERHGTELAGIVAGSEGPGGLHGIAPGASILPIRVAGWQPDAEGGYAVYSRTDQVLAGLEAAVDPNDDGDAHDAARIALVGVAEPYASFPDGPLARAIDGGDDARHARRRARGKRRACGADVRKHRRPGRRARRRSRSERWTAGRRRRPCASTCARRSACSSTACSRSGARRPTR